MFVRIAKKKNDHVSIRVVENIRSGGKTKQKIIFCIGHFHKDQAEKIEAHRLFGEEIIAKIKNARSAELSGHEGPIHSPHESSEILEKGNSLPGLGNLDEVMRVGLGVDNIFAHEFERLGFCDAINSGYKQDKSNELLKEMVLSRIERPTSKRDSVFNIGREREKVIKLDSIYRMMDKLHGRQEWVKDQIAGSALNIFSGKISVAFFDVTTLYFESFKPDWLRVSGFSKDNKIKETQVMLALMTTKEGIPLGYELFPGNTYEGNTLISAVDALRKRYEVEDTSIVADRAMFTEKNLKALEERGINFIVSAKLKNMKKAMVEEILRDVEEALLKLGDIDYWTGEYVHCGRRLVISYSKKRAQKDKKDRERLLKRLEKKLNGKKVRVADLVKNTGTKKYLKFDKNNKELATLDEEKIKESARWDGVYGIITSHDKERVSGGEILERYKGLWQIENAFRVNKHDLKMRPIYHWTPNRIESHILICYMAYALVSTVKYRLKKANVNLSFREIRKELSYVQASVVENRQTGQRFLLPSKITSKQRAIHQALGMKLEEKMRPLGQEIPGTPLS